MSLHIIETEVQKEGSRSQQPTYGLDSEVPGHTSAGILDKAVTGPAQTGGGVGPTSQ